MEITNTTATENQSQQSSEQLPEEQKQVIQQQDVQQPIQNKEKKAELNPKKKPLKIPAKDLACHFYHMSQCQNGSKCKFKHDNKQNKCPNGAICPMNHKRIVCPTIQTCIQNKFFHCEFFHPKRLVDKILNRTVQVIQKKMKNEVLKNAHEEKKKDNQIKQDMLHNDNQDEVLVYQYLNKLPAIFRIPDIPKQDKQSKQIFRVQYPSIIGVIDCSGSMQFEWENVSRYWNYLCKKYKKYYSISFASTVNFSKRNLLSTDIYSLWEKSGYLTNIYSAFNKLNKLIVDENITNTTIVFISDGYDNNLQKLKTQFTTLKAQIPKNVDINFICVGITGGDECLFPTNIAIELRNMYHNGSPNVPPLIYIPRLSDQYMFEKSFDYIYEYFDKPIKIELDQGVLCFPWSQPEKKAFEGQWVYSYEYQEISLKHKNNQYYQILCKQNLTTQEIIDLSKDLLTQLQLMACSTRANRELIRQYAQQTIKMISDLKLTKIKESIQKVHKPFKDKVIEWNEQQIGVLLMIVYQLELLSQGKEKDLDRLDNETMALRLSINTQIGKYEENAKKFKGCTIWEFQDIKQEFLDKLWKWEPYLKFTHSSGKIIATSTQPKSQYCKMNQLELFLEAGMEEGINQCMTQHQLAHQFPIVGYGCRIRRTDGSMINPYLISVLEITKTMITIDSQELVYNNGEIVIDNGEKFNCVLPLYEYSDQLISPLIRSRLFQLLMSFNVTSSVDTRYGYSYLALLANSFIYMVNQPESEWKTTLLNKIFVTLDLTFAHNNHIKDYSEILAYQPRKAVATEFWDYYDLKSKLKKKIVSKCEDLSKPLIMLFWLFKRKIVDQNQIKKILHAIIREIVGRFIPRNILPQQFMIVKNEKSVLEVLKQKLNIKDQVVNDFKPKLLQYYTLQELLRQVKEYVNQKSIKLDLKLDLQFPHTIFPEGKFNIKSVQRIYKFFFPDKEIRKHNMIVWVNHAFKYKNSFHRNNSEIDQDANKIYQNLTQITQNQLIKQETAKLLAECTLTLTNLYTQAMNEVHKQPEIFTDQSLAEICKQKQVPNSDQFKISSSNLLTNACSCPLCPFFLVRNKKISQHLAGVSFRVPGLNKVCKKFSNLGAEEVFEKVLSGQELRIFHVKKEKIGEQIKTQISDEVKIHLCNSKAEYIDIIKYYQQKYSNLKR